MDQNPPLMHKLGMISHIIQLKAGNLLQEKYDIALNSYIILNKAHHHKYNQQKIADKLQLTTAAISKRVSILIEKGLLKATINKENRRERHITVTKKGIEIVEKAEISLKECFDKLISEFDEQEELDRLLNKLLPLLCNREKNDTRTC